MSEAAPDWARDVLAFWFEELSNADWWSHSPELDAEIARRFGALWESERAKPAETFLGSAGEALAAVLLFDQFPRNLFRKNKRAFATDALALAIAKGAIECGYDADLTKERRQFLYMPFMHSEDLADQERSLELFGALSDQEALKFAREHRDLIARFGRFPHRNAILGRESTPEEIAWSENHHGWGQGPKVLARRPGR